MFLRAKDYYKQITSEHLGVVAPSDAIRQFAELTSQADIISYLTQRYRTENVFKDFKDWSLLTQYLYFDRIDFDATAYAAVTVYTNGTLLSYNSKIYEKNATTAGYVAGTLPTNTTYFTERGDQAIYYITPPVTWDENSTYTASTGKVTYRHDVYIRTSQTAGYEKGILPTNTTYFAKVTDYTPYAVTGVWPNDATKWTKGDNRNAQVIKYMIDMVLYDLHSQINPRQLPQLRIDRHKMAIAWIEACGSGDITADLPVREAQTGYAIRFGSNDKLNHSY